MRLGQIVPFGSLDDAIQRKCVQEVRVADKVGKASCAFDRQLCETALEIKHRDCREEGHFWNVQPLGYCPDDRTRDMLVIDLVGRRTSQFGLELIIEEGIVEAGGP